MLVPTGLYLAAFRPGDETPLAFVVDDDAQAALDGIPLADLEKRAGIKLLPAIPESMKRLALPGTTAPQEIEIALR